MAARMWLSGSGFQDIYLTNISLKDGDQHLARLVDLYTDTESQIAIEVLRQQPLLKITVLRDLSCDMKGNVLPARPRSVFVRFER